MCALKASDPLRVESLENRLELRKARVLAVLSDVRRRQE
jgi:hypothetical protein